MNNSFNNKDMKSGKQVICVSFVHVRFLLYLCGLAFSLWQTKVTIIMYYMTRSGQIKCHGFNKFEFIRYNVNFFKQKFHPLLLPRSLTRSYKGSHKDS